MTSQPLLKHYFCSSEISNLFQAKPQSKSIQRFNFSCTGKKKWKVRNKHNTLFLIIMMSSIFWMMSQNYLLLNQLFLQFIMKNYCFNTFSSPGIDLKLRKCVIKVWWRHKLSFTYVLRHNVINFWLKMLFQFFKKKYQLQTFQSFALSSKQERFLRFRWHHNDVTNL